MLNEIDISYITNITFALISVVATFLSANPKVRSKWIILFINISSLSVIFAYGIIGRFYQFNYFLYFIISGILLLFTIFVSFYVYRNYTFSKKRAGKMMIQFTNNIGSCDTIRLFCGDLSFLGDISDDSIKSNAQYHQLEQLVKKKACRIQIICHKVDNEEFILRLGFLQENLKGLRVKFYDNCKAHKTNLKHYNPDINLRGRIITSKSGIDYIILTGITNDDNSLYKPVIYNRASSSGNLYIKLWDIWWEKTEEDCQFLQMCRTMYDEYAENKANY